MQNVADLQFTDSYNSLLFSSCLKELQPPRCAAFFFHCELVVGLKKFSSSPRLHLLLCPHFIELSAYKGRPAISTIPNSQVKLKLAVSSPSLFHPFIQSHCVSRSLWEWRWCTFHQGCVRSSVLAHLIRWCEVLNPNFQVSYFFPEDSHSLLTLNVFTPCDLSSS